MMAILSNLLENLISFSDYGKYNFMLVPTGCFVNFESFCRN